MENNHIPEGIRKFTTRDAGSQQDAGARTGNICDSLEPLPPENQETVKTVGARAYKRALAPTDRQLRHLNRACYAVKETYNEALRLSGERYDDYVGYTAVIKNEYPDRIRFGQKAEFKDLGVKEFKDLPLGTYEILAWVSKTGECKTVKSQTVVIVKEQHPPSLDKKPTGNIASLRTHVVPEKSAFLNRIPTEKRFLIESVGSQTRNNVIDKNLDSAFKNFFGGRADYPKFKKRCNSFPVPNNTFKVLDEKHVALGPLSGFIGRVKLHETLIIPNGAKIAGATVSWEGRRWYVSVTLTDVPLVRFKAPNKVIGIDLNTTAETSIEPSEGASIEAPKPLFKNLKRLQMLSKRASRCKKGSRNQKKIYEKIGKLHSKISDIRKDWQNKATTSLASSANVIVMEDLAVSAMVKGRRGKGIPDIGFNEIKRQLVYKTQERGGSVWEIPRFHSTSKPCNACGWRDEEIHNRKDRFFMCGNTSCFEHLRAVSRDRNSAKNIAQGFQLGIAKNLGEEALESAKESKLKGDLKRSKMVKAKKDKAQARRSKTGVELIENTDENHGAVEVVEENHR